MSVQKDEIRSHCHADITPLDLFMDTNMANMPDSSITQQAYRTPRRQATDVASMVAKAQPMH